MDIFELFGTIAINNDKANKALADTGKLASGLSGKMEAAFSKVQSAAMKIGTAVATAFAVDKIKDFGLSCAETFATVAAEESAFAQIMGDYAERATEKMKLVADQTGVVTTRLTPYMTSMTAKFKGLGYGVEEATNLASEGLMIASDAAAFWDRSLDDSMSHLNSFINGSYEGGEAIGLFANDTQMAAYAVSKGIVKETKAWSNLNEAAKQSTRLQYAKEMMAKSGATGQAALEAENYANVQANLNEQMRQFHAIIGEPVMNNIMLPAMRRVSQYMPQITEKATAFIKTYSDGFNQFASHFSTIFTEKGVDLSKLPGAFSKAMASVWPKIQEKFKAKLGIELPEWKTIETNVTAWWTGTKTALDKVCTWVMQLPENPSEAPDMIARVVETWWTGTALPAIQSVSGWTLQMFGHPVEDEATIQQHVAEWWKLAGEVVSGACTWTLKLFDMPEESAEAIGEKVKTWWNSVLGAVDKETWSAFFADFSTEAKEGLEDSTSILGLALDAISGLSKIGTESVTKALDWILTHGEAVAVALEAMSVSFMLAAAAAHPWATAIVLAATALGLMKEYGGEDRYDHFFDGFSAEELQNLQAYVDAMNAFNQAQEEMLAMDDPTDDIIKRHTEAKQKLDFTRTRVSDDLLGLYNSWNTGQDDYKPGYYKAVPLKVVDDAEASLQAEIEKMVMEGKVDLYPDGNAIQSYLNSGSFSAYVNMIPSGTQAAGRWIDSLPGHADGLDFVPRDNYLARLHKGEAVLTSAEASVWRSGSMGGGDISRLETAISSMSALLQQVVNNTASGHSVVLDSGVLVGQLAPALDTQLGTISSRKGRRN